LLAGLDAVSSLRAFSFLLTTAGIVLDVLGLFLPWGDWSWTPGVLTLLGIDISEGPLALFWWFIGTVSWVRFVVKGQKQVLKPSKRFSLRSILFGKGLLTWVRLGGLAAVVSAFAWIASPGISQPSVGVYTVSYGAYVSLAGGTLILLGAALSSFLLETPHATSPSTPNTVSIPENSLRSRKMWTAALAVGLVIGLGLGIIVGVVFILPRMTQEVLFAINPVQVSGAVGGVREGRIQFINEYETNSTRYSHHVQIMNGNYSIVLSGGYDYTVSVSIGGLTSALYTFSLYVPSNVTTLTANFQP
jgi:hypothetical protein